MYTDKKNILQLAALLEAYGITRVVLCPGSRNAPIVHTRAGCRRRRGTRALFAMQ